MTKSYCTPLYLLNIHVLVFRCHQEGRISPHLSKALLDDEAKDSSRKDLEQELEEACDGDFEKEMVSYLKLCM